MTTKRRGRSRRSGSRVKTAWWNISTLKTSLGPGAIGIFDLLPIGALPNGFEGGLTVLRMIGALSIVPATANLPVQYAQGVLTMTTQAFTSGNVPNPLVDLVDWYYLQHGFIQQASIETDERPFDIRTARRIRGEDRTLVHAIINSASSATTLTYTFSTRLLLARS